MTKKKGGMLYLSLKLSFKTASAQKSATNIQIHTNSTHSHVSKKSGTDQRKNNFCENEGQMTKTPHTSTPPESPIFFRTDLT